MRGRLFWLAIFLIGLSWIVNSFYAHSKQLDEPIFLDHYIEHSVHEGSFLTLYYLTNVNDDSHVSHVNFGGITAYVARDDFFDDFGFGFYENEVNPDIQTFTHYALRKIQIELNLYEFEDLLKDNDELIVHDIEMFFSDGRDITVPIGEVVLHHPFQIENVLDQWGSSAGDNWNIFTYTVGKNLTIDQITFNFDEVLQDQFFVKIDSTNAVSVLDHSRGDLTTDNWDDVPGVDIRDMKFPYEVKKDEKFTLYTQISPDFIGSLESSVVFTGTTESGRPFKSYSLYNNQQPYLEQKDVDKLLQERGVSK